MIRQKITEILIATAIIGGSGTAVTGGLDAARTAPPTRPRESLTGLVVAVTGLLTGLVGSYATFTRLRWDRDKNHREALAFAQGNRTMIEAQGRTLDSIHASLGQGSVLVVENDRPTRLAMAAVICGDGYSVTHAGTLAVADEALNLRPEVVVLDLDLDGESGLSLLYSMARRNLSPRVIVVTGLTEDSAGRRRADGDPRIECVLVKPVAPEILLRAIARPKPVAPAPPAPRPVHVFGYGGPQPDTIASGGGRDTLHGGAAPEAL